MLTRGTERREYFGFRSKRKVFGRWNFGFVNTFVDFLVLVPTARALAAFFALSPGFFVSFATEGGTVGGRRSDARALFRVGELDLA